MGGARLLEKMPRGGTPARSALFPVDRSSAAAGVRVGSKVGWGRSGLFQERRWGDERADSRNRVGNESVIAAVGGCPLLSVIFIILNNCT